MLLKPLSMQFIFEFSKQYNIDPALILAIGKKESNLQNYDKNGLLISRFEPHIYRGFLLVWEGKLNRHPLLPGIKADWIRKHKKDELKLLATSYGIFQIMGYWYEWFGYNNLENCIKEIINDWMVEEVCVQEFLLFCLKYRDGQFLKALQEKKYLRIALMYNGKGFRKNNYDIDLEIFHRQIQQVIKNVN